MTFPEARAMTIEVCDRCSGAMIFNGRISLPPQIIYKCESCGNQKWTAETSPRYRLQASQPLKQPQAQQQQQSQPDREPEK
jgi:hypothetical protein